MKKTKCTVRMSEPLSNYATKPPSTHYQDHVGLVIRASGSGRLMLGTKSGWVVLEGSGIGLLDRSIRFRHRVISKIDISAVYADDYDCMGAEYDG